MVAMLFLVQVAPGLYQLQRKPTSNLFRVSIRKNATEVRRFSGNPRRVPSLWRTWTRHSPPLLLARL